MKLKDCKPGTRVRIQSGVTLTYNDGRILSARGPIVTVLTDNDKAYAVHHCRLKEISCGT